MVYTTDIVSDGPGDPQVTIAEFKHDVYRNVCLKALQEWFREQSDTGMYRSLVKGVRFK